MSFMKYYILMCLLAGSASRCIAQFNDTTHYYFRYGATGIVNHTNDIKSFLLTNALTFTVRKQKVEMNSASSWIYGRSDKLTNNDFTSVFNVDFLRKTKRLYYWGLANYTTSYSLKIYKQFQVGAGIGFTFVNNPKLQLVLSDGLLYETNDLEDAQLGRDKYQTVRNSLRFKYRWVIGTSVSFEGATYWQPSLKNFDDYIVKSNNSLSLKLRRWLSLVSSFNYNRFSRTDRENLLLTFGLVAETYF